VLVLVLDFHLLARKKNDERNLKAEKKPGKPKEKKEKKRKKKENLVFFSFLLHLVVSSVYFIHSFLTHHALREYTTT